MVYCGGRGQLGAADPHVQNMVSVNLNQTYRSALYHTYTATRISQLFDIVIGTKQIVFYNHYQIKFVV